MLCMLAMHINIFTVSVLLISPIFLTFIFSLWDRLPATVYWNLIGSSCLFSDHCLYYLFFLSSHTTYQVLIQNGFYHSANISTRSLLPRLLDQRSSPCTPPKWFNFWFILIIYGLNIFPSEKSIPWMKKKKGFCCCWCSFVLYFNNVPRGTNMLKFLSIYLKESSHLKKIHMSKLVSSLWIAKVSLKG